jgi:predicted nucleic acid-binding protein
MVAAVCSWHEHHELAANEIGRRLDRRERMIVAAPALVEAYAVLTRLPPPHRISPEAALALLDNNFIQSVTVVALTAKSYGALLRLAPEKGISGGRSYDAVIGACAEKGKASTLLTFNASDFTALGKHFTVVVPGSV